MKTAIYVPLMTIFPKQKLFVLLSKSIGQSLISTCFYQVSCVFMGSKFLGSHCRLRMLSNTFANFHHWIHMSNQEYGVFHLRRYLPLLAIPNTRIFHFLFLLCNRETHFRCCPILPSPPSNTNHNVNLYHALTPMSCDVPCINAMQDAIACYHVTCTMNATWIALLMYITNASLIRATVG